MKALEGLRVIDFTQAMAAPFGTMNLADMGADVIKIEPPVTGEPTRELSSVTQNGHSATFMTMNRSKRGLTVDLKTPEGVLVVKRLAKTADVFVQNYRPGVAERLGLGLRRALGGESAAHLLLGERLRRHGPVRAARRL